MRGWLAGRGRAGRRRAALAAAALTALCAPPAAAPASAQEPRRPPPPVIEGAPDATTTATTARLTFSSPEARVRFLCALDGGRASRCTSPWDVAGLAEGEHRFDVVAVDARGARSAPASAEWTVLAPSQTLGDGAWSWFADPRAVRHDGLRHRTYAGWVARDGDVEVTAYDHVSLTRTTAVLASGLQVDDHANPALQVLPDGRLRVFYSAHAGRELLYRTSTRPEDVSSWSEPRTLPSNTPGVWGFTYPNPVHLADEGRTYLFWRGGDFNPAVARQGDGEDGWSAARPVVAVPGERPYVKVDTDGRGTIHLAFTNAHPREADDVDIHYVRYRAGVLRRADGTRVGTLPGPAITPGQADLVADRPENTWVHDVAADAAGRPVVVFASFPAPGDHRYHYARWTGRRWLTHEITAAGGSISGDPREPQYSGGITLDHEDPAMVVLSRQVGGVFEVERWRTPDGGATWTSHAVTAASPAQNVRPVTPRGLVAQAADLSVLWMRGEYPSYIDYRTSITTDLRLGGNRLPVAAAATPAPAAGPAPQAVELDASASRDEDGRIARVTWDLGDGTRASGVRVRHTYRAPGRWFPAVTVTDDAGGQDTYVTEVVVAPASAPLVATGPASAVTETSATLNGTVDPRNQPTTAWFEFGPTTALGLRTPEQDVAPADVARHPVAAEVLGLTAGTTYHARLVARNATGTTAGAIRTFTARAPASSAYRAAVLATPGLLALWRLGEVRGPVAADETGRNAGTYVGDVVLGEPGALADDPDPAAGFDGVGAEVLAPAPALGASGTLEAWVDWRAGVAVLRDHTASGGWILAYDSAGALLYRAGATTFTSGLRTADLRGAWHHLALTKDGPDVALHVDGRVVHRATGAASAPSVSPWHVMHNGTIAGQFAQGRVDEVAVYDRALPAATIAEHHRVGAGLRAARRR